METKKETIRQMFNSIANNYDFLNHLLSLGIDRYWRKKVIQILQKELHQKSSVSILDIATGTGDLAIQAVKLKPKKITGIDISEEMLAVAKLKISKKNLHHLIEFQIAEAENIPFAGDTFDAAIVAFGVRNFYNLPKGLEEICRILKTDGILVVLEFSKPSAFPIKQLYNFYFKNILPFVGKLFSKSDSAYQYLPDSVSVFPQGNNFLNIMQQAGFNTRYCKTLTFGISTIYVGKK